MAPQGYTNGNWASCRPHVVNTKTISKHLPLYAEDFDEPCKKERSPMKRSPRSDRLPFRIQLALMYYSLTSKKAAFSAPRIVLWSLLLLLALAVTFLVWVFNCERDECRLIVIKMAFYIFLPAKVRNLLFPYVGVRDGRIDIRVEEFSPHVRSVITNHLGVHYYNPDFHVKTRLPANRTFKPMNIAFLLIGSLGDVQPFVPVAQQLKAMGHRVRVATHKQFRPQVTKQGLEFYPLGGSPKIFVSHLRTANWYFSLNYISTVKFLMTGAHALWSIWPAVTQPDLASGGKPFRADLMIVSSHAFGYEIIAERLQIPVHLVNVFPTAPTMEAPACSVVHRDQWTPSDNRVTYAMYDGCPWVALHPFLNAALQVAGFPNQPLERKQLLIPHTFLYSTHIQPRFSDWGDHIDVVGSSYLPARKTFAPDPVVAKFMEGGDAPIFIGFGSMVHDNPRWLTLTLIEALKESGQRGVIQRGWAKLGEGIEPHEIPPNVLIVDYVPHDWLLPQCSAIIHHGGSGTVAAGLRAGLPTLTVTFILDQPFWGRRVFELGVGPEAIPVAELTVPKLVKAIHFLQRPEVRAAAEELGSKIAQQNGAVTAAESILSHIPDGYEPGQPCMPWRHATDATSPSYGQWTC